MPQGEAGLRERQHGALQWRTTAQAAASSPTEIDRPRPVFAPPAGFQPREKADAPLLLTPPHPSRSPWSHWARDPPSRASECLPSPGQSLGLWLHFLAASQSLWPLGKRREGVLRRSTGGSPWVWSGVPSLGLLPRPSIALWEPPDLRNECG